MAVLQNKIDFALVISVVYANPNGDPLDGNRPRTTFDGRGEISDVCLKRKIRNRLQDEGYPILVQSDDRRKDDCRSINDRVNSIKELKEMAKKASSEEYAKVACQTWLDVRAFGQVFAFGKSDEADSKSIGVRGPVTIQSAFSVEPVDVSSLQITKSVNLTTGKDPDRKAPDTMGTKHRVDKGIYVTKGSINVQLAEKTAFSDSDAEAVKEALRTLFRNDASAARPDGSMEVLKLIWWRHNCKNGQYSSAKVHHTLQVASDGSIEVESLPGLEPEVMDGE
jgi:CRISPR-associated protein Csd2